MSALQTYVEDMLVKQSGVVTLNRSEDLGVVGVMVEEAKESVEQRVRDWVSGQVNKLEKIIL